MTRFVPSTERETRDYMPVLATCAWLQRLQRVPGHDPEGICSFGCWEEPDCQTSGPFEALPGPARYEPVEPIHTRTTVPRRRR